MVSQPFLQASQHREAMYTGNCFKIGNFMAWYSC